MGSDRGEILRVEESARMGRYEELVSLFETLRRLSDLQKTLRSSRDLVQRLARILVKETPFDLCAVFRSDHHSGELGLWTGFGVPARWFDESKAQGLPLGPKTSLHELAMRALQRNTVQFAEAVPVDESLRVPDQGLATRFWSLVGVPLGKWGSLVLADLRAPVLCRDRKRHWEMFSAVLGEMLAYWCTVGESESEGRVARREGPCEDRIPVGTPEAPTAEEKLLDALMALLPQGMCLLNGDGRIVRINPRLAGLLDVASAGLLGRSPHVLFARPGDFKALKSRADRDGSTRVSDLVMGGDGMATFPADVFLADISHILHPTVKYVLILEDISERRAFSRQLMRTEKLAALGTMAGGVAHDFNNILMSILGNTQLLVQEMESGTIDVQRRLRSIEQAVSDGAHIARRLQEFADKKSSRDRQEQRSDIRSAVMDVIELTRPRWKNALERAGHTVEVRMNLRDGLEGAIHPADLREVLTNLVFNAVDAMPRGGRLSFRSFRESHWVVLEVSDTGVGMDPQIRQRIFDPFFSTKGVGNSGLGLSVCRGLILRCGGEMLVSSEVGRGTTFAIKLPVAEQRDRTAAQAVGLTLQTTDKRLLVVDDEKEILELLRDMLRLIGHRVTATHEPKRALDYLVKDSFDLVLTDLAMPEVTGWDVAKAAKAAKDSLPVILVTGWGAQFEGRDLSDRGVDLVLSKPLSYQKLMESLTRFL